MNLVFEAGSSERHLGEDLRALDRVLQGLLVARVSNVERLLVIGGSKVGGLVVAHEWFARCDAGDRTEAEECVDAHGDRRFSSCVICGMLG